MKINLMETQTQTFPLYGEDGTQCGMLTPDHDGYLVAAKSTNWQDAESEAFRAEIDEHGGTFRQKDNSDGSESFWLEY